MTAHTAAPGENEDDTYTPVDTAPPQPVQPERPPRRSRRRHEDQPRRRIITALIIALAGLNAALLVGSLVLAIDWHQERKQDQQRSNAVEAAKTMAVDLTSVDHTRVDGDVAELVTKTTGTFERLFRKNVDIYLDTVKEQRMTATTRVAGAGIQTFTGTSAQVLVGVDTQIQRSDVGTSRTRRYRMSIDLEKQPDGQWLTSDVAFLP